MSKREVSERAEVVAYVLNESAEYDNSDGVVAILEELADKLSRGEHMEASRHGELDDWMSSLLVLRATAPQPPEPEAVCEPYAYPCPQCDDDGAIVTGATIRRDGRRASYTMACRECGWTGNAVWEPKQEPVCAADAVVEAVEAWQAAHVSGWDPRERAACELLQVFRTATIRTEAEVRAEAFREAAEACEAMDMPWNCSDSWDDGIRHCAKAIRALAEGEGE